MRGTGALILIGVMSAAAASGAIVRNPMLKPPNFIAFNAIGMLSWQPVKDAEFYKVYRNGRVIRHVYNLNRFMDEEQIESDYYQITAVVDDVESRMTGSIDQLPWAVKKPPEKPAEIVHRLRKPSRVRAFADGDSGYATVVWNGPPDATIYEIYDNGFLISIVTSEAARVPFRHESEFTIVASDDVNYSEHSTPVDVLGIR